MRAICFFKNVDDVHNTSVFSFGWVSWHVANRHRDLGSLETTFKPLNNSNTKPQRAFYDIMKALAIHIEDIEKIIIFTIERYQSDEPVRDVACFYYIGMATKFQSQLWHVYFP